MNYNSPHLLYLIEILDLEKCCKAEYLIENRVQSSQNKMEYKIIWVLTTLTLHVIFSTLYLTEKTDTRAKKPPRYELTIMFYLIYYY